MNRGNLSKPSPNRLTPKVVVLDIPDRITNASQREPLKQKPWNVRAGSDAFLAVQSRGVRT